MTEYKRVAVTSNETDELSTSKSLIDHCWTNIPQYILKSGVVQLGMVYHYMINAVQKVNASRLKRNNPKRLSFVL